MSVVTTREEFGDFLTAVYEACGDPAGACCLLCVPWGVPLHQTKEETFGCTWNADPFGCTWNADHSVLLLEIGTPEVTRIFPLEVSVDGPAVSNRGLEKFHIRKLGAGVWVLNPSLNLPEVLHGYVVIHGAPDPAPWESRILLATGLPGVTR